MPLTGKLTSALLCSTMLGGPIMSAAATGALLLLTGENEGFAIDATTYDSITAATYVGGPVGGTVAIKELDSPAALMSNVALDDPRSPLVQSGTSPKMVMCGDALGDSPGSTYPLVRWTPHNLVLQSQVFGTTWTASQTVTSNSAVAPDGTTTADTITSNSGFENVQQSISGLSIDSPYCFSLYIKKTSGATYFPGLQLYINPAAYSVTIDTDNGTVTSRTGETPVASGIEDAGTYWRVYVVGLTDADGAVQPTLYPNVNTDHSATWVGGAGTQIIWGAQINRGYTPTPYLVTTTAARIGIPQEYDRAAEKWGILVEPAATNLCLRSEDLSTTWVNTNSSESTNSTTAPDGSTTADTLIEDATESFHKVDQQTASAGGGGLYTGSVYLKRKDRQWAFVSMVQTSGSNRYTIIVDLDNGTVVDTEISNSPTSTSYSVTSVGDGWYRCAVTANVASDYPYFSFGLSNSATPSYLFATPLYTGDGTSGLYVWGAQVEDGSVATSYIPTLGSTVTRAADNIAALTSTVPHSATENTAYISVKARLNTAQHNFFSVSDGLQIYSDGTDGSTFLYCYDFALQANIDSTKNLAANTILQATGTWKANDFAVSVDGVAVQTDTAGTIPAGLTTIYVGADSVPANWLNGYVYKLVYVPRRVTDGDLPTWRYNF